MYFMFPVGKERFLSLVGIPSGIFRHCKFDKFFTIVSICIFKKLGFSNLERGADLGRSRLVFIKIGIVTERVWFMEGAIVR